MIGNVANNLQRFLVNLFQWWVVIAPWEQAVRVRLGKHVSLHGPGVQLRIPFVDRYFLQPIRVRALIVEPQTLTTSDFATVTLSSTLRYEIADLLLLYRTLHDAKETVAQTVQGLIADYVYGRAYDQLRPADIEETVLSGLDLSEYGLRVKGFSVVNFARARTYRIISEGLNAQQYSPFIDMSREQSFNGAPA